MSDPEPVEKPAITQEEFLAWRSPRLGDTNPTDLTNPLWAWMVRTRFNAYQGNQAWGGPSPFDAGPMCCFDRFGQSTTALPDGRTLYIAGEHEDSYDPDFFIYNDVVVVQRDGAITIHGYPKDVFPPTDFHTATLAGGRIVVIGNLGYRDERVVGKTQVLELALDTLSVRIVETHGEGPGWLNRHGATLSDAADAIVVSGGEVYLGPDQDLWENVDDWQLDLATWTWARHTRKGWPQWGCIRADHQLNSLWDMRHALWYRGVGWKDDFAQEVARVTDRIGFAPDLELVASLYRLDESVVDLPLREDELGIVRVVVDGVTVKFREDSFWVRAVVEGTLAPDRLEALQASVLDKLTRLTRTPWTVHAPDWTAGRSAASPVPGAG
ncbi:MAG TPA: hypothetical protein VI032_10575 [Burkholderiaceae bacterium]